MSKIAWTEQTWNPVSGCTKISPGCKNCYAEKMAKRLKAMGQQNYTNGFGVTFHAHMLDVPLRRRKPTTFFVNSMSDLFHEELLLGPIARVFAVMAYADQHRYQVLTKRAERMSGVVNDPAFRALVEQWWEDLLFQYEEYPEEYPDMPWPLPNVWLGVSVEGQKYADERIPHLLQTPAAVRFLSCEPLLEPLNLSLGLPTLEIERESDMWKDLIRWVIVGGESGPGARPCQVEWIRDIVRQCKDAGVAAFVKQDSGPRSGMQGRIPDELWAVKEMPL